MKEDTTTRAQDELRPRAPSTALSGEEPALERVPRELWPPGMRIVNDQLAHSIRAQGMLREPNRYGYIHLAGEVEWPRVFRRPTSAKRALLAELKAAARALMQDEPQVRRADVFDALFIPPGSKEGRRVLERERYGVHVAEFDVAVLVECESVEAAAKVRAGAAFRRLERALESRASFVHCVTAKNPKRIAEVDKERQGVFLFNYFFAADVAGKGAAGAEILLSVWEYTAGWWTAKANLDNSTPLEPVEGERSQYALINHCRWERLRDVLPHLIFRPSLHRFVLANFTANDIVAMPILYRLA